VKPQVICLRLRHIGDRLSVRAAICSPQLPSMSAATRSAASRCRPLRTCEYVPRVIWMLDCPRRSWTYLLTPACSAAVAHPCRRSGIESCEARCPRPDLRRRRSGGRGWMGEPSSRLNTQSLVRCAGPTPTAFGLGLPPALEHRHRHGSRSTVRTFSLTYEEAAA